MAKVGEGDPRWIVSNRDDGKNVNAWHWEEKDLSKSSHSALKGLFAGHVVAEKDGDVAGFKFTELSEIDGDITVAQRKGKIMCYFEVKMTAKWEATVGETKVEGKLSALDIEHDNFGEDFELKVSTVQRSSAAARAEAVAQKAGRKAFRAITKQFFDELFAQYSVGTKVGGVLPPGAAVPVGSPTAASPISVSSRQPSSASAQPTPSAATATKVASAKAPATASGSSSNAFGADSGARFTVAANTASTSKAGGDGSGMLSGLRAAALVAVPLAALAAFAYTKYQ